MPENYDHYITKNIKALYKRRLFSPIVYLIIVIVLWHVFSLTDLLFPMTIKSVSPRFCTSSPGYFSWIHAIIFKMEITYRFSPFSGIFKTFIVFKCGRITRLLHSIETRSPSVTSRFVTSTFLSPFTYSVS